MSRSRPVRPPVPPATTHGTRSSERQQGEEAGPTGRAWRPARRPSTSSRRPRRSRAGCLAGTPAVAARRDGRVIGAESTMSQGFSIWAGSRTDLSSSSARSRSVGKGSTATSRCPVRRSSHGSAASVCLAALRAGRECGGDVEYPDVVAESGHSCSGPPVQAGVEVVNRGGGAEAEFGETAKTGPVETKPRRRCPVVGGIRSGRGGRRRAVPPRRTRALRAARSARRVGPA